MNPGALIPDVGHFEEIAIETCLTNRVLEEGFMGSGRTRGNDDAVQPMFFDLLLHQFLGILRTGVEVILHMDDARQCSGIFGHCRDVHHSPDIDPAMADKDPNTRPFIIHVLFRNVFLFGD
jgi:hypothetical protein